MTGVITIRDYADTDETDVLDLLTSALGPGPAGRRTADFFRWKHLDNPFGRSMLLVAESAGRIIGLRAFMRWRFRAGDRTVAAVRAVDTSTHPEFQGRGVFSRLTLEAVERLKADGTQLVFNTPNDKSGPGYLKMGWREVGRVPVRIGIRRPLRFAAGVRGIGETAAATTSNAPVRAGVDARAALATSEVEALALTSRRPDERLTTERTIDFLRWRYGAAPLLGYRAAVLGSTTAVRGVAFFRIRPRGNLVESTVADILVAPDDVATARRLLRVAGRGVDHVACSFPTGSSPARAATRSGYVPAPGGMRLVAKRLDDDIAPDPTVLSSWAWTLGDLEVF